MNRHRRDVMKILIHCRNMELTSALKTYTQSKLMRAVQHFKGMVQEADVHLSVARNPRIPQQTAEVTIFANGVVIRAQERSENLYASIDLVSSKICRQLQKYKGKHSDHHNHGHSASLAPKIEETIKDTSIEESLIEGKEAKLPQPGIRRKYFSMTPMNINQARQQLDLIDHDFYLFREHGSNTLRVIYKRNHGGYGLIQEKD